MIESRTVDWWSVHRYAEPTLTAAASWPMVGSLPWQHLPTDDPAKLAAVLDAARHWALRVETAQDAMAEASRAISTAADWPAVARGMQRRRSGVYIPRAPREVA